MTRKEFKDGFKLVEQSSNPVGLELKEKIWEKMRDLPVEVWDKICDKLLEQYFEFPSHPILKDFLDLRSEYLIIKAKMKCLRCEKSSRINDDPDGHFCDECFAYVNSPVGAAKIKKRREALQALGRSL